MANESFHNFSLCNTRIINEVVLGETLHKWQHVQLMIDDYKHYTVSTKCHPDSGKPSASKFMCTNTEKYETQRKRYMSIGE